MNDFAPALRGNDAFASPKFPSGGPGVLPATRLWGVGSAIEAMRFGWLVVAIFAGRFFMTALYFPAGDGDLGWQRWLGHHIVASGALPQRLGNETFTAAGSSWVPQEWLFSLAAYAAEGRFSFALPAFCALCATLTLVLCGWRAGRLGASPYGVAAAVAFAGIALLESFGVRVQVVAWPLLIVFLLALESDGPAAYLAIAVAAFWSNVHASAMLAPALAFVYFAGSFFDRGWNGRTRRYLVISLASAAATCANPLGYKLPLYAMGLFSSPFKSLISEWAPTRISDYAFAYGALPLLICIAAFGLQGVDRWRNRMLVAVTACLMFSAARNVAVFALCAAPLAARAFTLGIPELGRGDGTTRRRARFAFAIEPAIALVLAVVAGWTIMQVRAAGGAPDKQPRAAIAAIRALPGIHNVLCADFAWCSYLLGSGRARVFLDGRADPYPVSVWNDFGNVIHVRSNWQRTLRERSVDDVMVARTSPLEAALSLSNGWHSIYVDRDYRVWQRTGTLRP